MSLCCERASRESTDRAIFELLMNITIINSISYRIWFGLVKQYKDTFFMNVTSGKVKRGKVVFN